MQHLKDGWTDRCRQVASRVYVLVTLAKWVFSPYNSGRGRCRLSTNWLLIERSPFGSTDRALKQNVCRDNIVLGSRAENNVCSINAQVQMKSCALSAPLSSVLMMMMRCRNAAVERPRGPFSRLMSFVFQESMLFFDHLRHYARVKCKCGIIGRSCLSINGEAKWPQSAVEQTASMWLERTLHHYATLTCQCSFKNHKSWGGFFVCFFSK